jgi:hypothetical protein
MLTLHFLLYALQSAGGGSAKQEGVDAADPAAHTHIYLNPKPFLTPKRLKVVDHKPFLTPKSLKVVDPRDKNEWIPQILLPLPSFAERAYTEAGKEKLAVRVCVCLCVCMCVYLHARARVHTHTHTHTHTHIHTHTHVISIYLSIYIYIIYIYIYIYIGRGDGAPPIWISSGALRNAAC